MRTIHLTNDKKRNAQVGFESIHTEQRVIFHAPDGHKARNVRFLKATLEQSAEALLSRAGSPDALSRGLVEGDPEIDMERVGRQLGAADRVLLSPEGHVIHSARIEEILYNPDGSERERRAPVITDANIDLDTPLAWTGKLFPRKEVLRKFVLQRKAQIMHVNGLTFDFLYEMAKNLHEKDHMLLLGGGPRGNLPLVFQRGGGTYRGFLEGRIQGEKYCLMLHLSNLELKATPKAAE